MEFAGSCHEQRAGQSEPTYRTHHWKGMLSNHGFCFRNANIIQADRVDDQIVMNRARLDRIK